MRKGQTVVTQRGNKLEGFTAYKSYEVIAGNGDANLSPTALKFGMPFHTENSFNVVDDQGSVRFATMDAFRPFDGEFGLVIGSLIYVRS